MISVKKVMQRLSNEVAVYDSFSKSNISMSAGIDLTNLNGASYTIDRDGIYLISMQWTFNSRATSSTKNMQLSCVVNGANVHQTRILSAGQNFQILHLCYGAYLRRGDVVTARGTCSLATQGDMLDSNFNTIVYLGAGGAN